MSSSLPVLDMTDENSPAAKSEQYIVLRRISADDLHLHDWEIADIGAKNDTHRLGPLDVVGDRPFVGEKRMFYLPLSHWDAVAPTPHPSIRPTN